MKQSLNYFFSFCFLLSLFFAQAQEPKTTNSIPQNLSTTETNSVNTPQKQENKLEAAKKDSIPSKKDRYGLIVGVDLNKVIRSLYDSDYKGIGFVGNYRLTKKMYLAGEIGNENVTVDDSQLNFTTKGSYTKLGFDYNTYNNWLDMENLITLGLRYGFSTFSQQLNNYDIYNPNPYFGQVPTATSGELYKGLTASWAEVVTGINVKVFNNVYVGFNFQLKILVTNVEPNNFSNLYIPGFNRTYDGNFGAGFSYTVSYFIPIYKKKVTPVKTEAKKK
jgi:hypothetical protein